MIKAFIGVYIILAGLAYSGCVAQCTREHEHTKHFPIRGYCFVNALIPFGPVIAIFDTNFYKNGFML
jgi:hypothetical protein